MNFIEVFKVMNNRLFNFVGGDSGAWKVVKMETVKGLPLTEIARIKIIQGELESMPKDSVWNLRGVTSYARYVNRAEKDLLIARQEGK